MDKVKAILLECPFLRTIGDFELTVWRDPGSLDRGQVCARHVCGWELIREVDSPDAGAGADIKDFLRAGTDGRVEKLAIK